MRRREQSRSFSLPERLSAFDPDSWEGKDTAERYGAWMRARGAWADSRGLVGLPGDEEAWAAYPDGEFRIEDL